jgi:uncharacterized protein
MNDNTSDNAACLHNTQLLRRLYEESAQGKRALFQELAADDITWWKVGTTTWSKTYRGRQEVSALFQRLFALLEGSHCVTAQRFIAERDLVVVEATGRAVTKAGKRYDNTYCMIYRFADGKIKEVREYCDTALIDAVLSAAPR